MRVFGIKKPPSRFAWRIAASLDKKRGKTLNSFLFKKPNNPEQSGITCYSGRIFLVRRPFYPAENKKNPEQSVFIRVQGFWRSLFGPSRPRLVSIGKVFPCQPVRLGVGSFIRRCVPHSLPKSILGYPCPPARYRRRLVSSPREWHPQCPPLAVWRPWLRQVRLWYRQEPVSALQSVAGRRHIAFQAL